jgi:flavin reductase (DIM6/NTAB) family NADH-FMN oxidoreductase RutF
LTNQHSPRAWFIAKEPTRLTTCRTVSTNAATVKATTLANGDEKELGKVALSDQVRMLMRRVPHPVAIVTASDCTASRDRAFRGMTVSSFNTITLYPAPVVSFNVKQPSETLNAIQSSGRFLVHLLASSAATAKLARAFSRGNGNLQPPSGLGDFEFSLLDDASPQSSVEPPALRRQKYVPRSEHPATDPADFPFILDCIYNPEYSIQVHDHTIVMGTVVKVLEHPHPNDRGERSTTEDLCLTYADTRFWKMGDEV